MSMLYLVRHGQASAGTHDYDRLSPLGRRQSKILGAWWAEQGFEMQQAYHGSLLRQRDTAALALEQAQSTVKCKEHPGLNEYSHRDIEAFFAPDSQDNGPESMSFTDYVEIMSRWRDGQEQALSQDIEPWQSFSRRGWDTVRGLHASSEERDSHVFFTSGGVIATLLSTVLELDFAHTVDAIWRIRNTSITSLHFDGHHARLVDFNTVPHLQALNDPSLITLI